MMFFSDENFPKSALKVVAARGHDYFDVREHGSLGAEDHSLFQMAIEMDAVMLTTDRDFFHTIHFQYDEHPGIIVVALKQPNRAAISKRLEWFLDNFELTLLRNRAFQLRDSTWIARPPLPA